MSNGLTPSPRFDVLGPPGWGERIQHWFKEFVFVDLEWTRMVFISFIPTLVSLVAQIIIQNDLTLSMFFLTPAWIRWSATLTLLSATWLLTSSTATQADHDVKRDWILLLFALWGVTLTVSLGIEIVLAGPETKVKFKYWFVCGSSFALLLLDFASCVRMRKIIFTRVLGI
jgi:hypothetical protein